MSWIEQDDKASREETREREAARHFRWLCCCLALTLSTTIAAILARSFFLVVPIVICGFLTWRQWTEWKFVKRPLAVGAASNHDDSSENKKGETFRCSFCGKTEEEVAHLISSPKDVGMPRAHICDQCIAVCNSILEDIKSGKQ